VEVKEGKKMRARRKKEAEIMEIVKMKSGGKKRWVLMTKGVWSNAVGGRRQAIRQTMKRYKSTGRLSTSKAGRLLGLSLR